MKEKRSFAKFVYFLVNQNVTWHDSTVSIFMKAFNLYQLRPTLSLVRNYGWDNTGEHCRADAPKAVEFRNQCIDVSEEFTLQVDEKMFKEDIIKFNNKYLNKEEKFSLKDTFIAIIYYLCFCFFDIKGTQILSRLSIRKNLMKFLKGY